MSNEESAPTKLRGAALRAQQAKLARLAAEAGQPAAPAVAPVVGASSSIKNLIGNIAATPVIPQKTQGDVAMTQTAEAQAPTTVSVQEILDPNKPFLYADAPLSETTITVRGKGLKKVEKAHLAAAVLHVRRGPKEQSGRGRKSSDEMLYIAFNGDAVTHALLLQIFEGDGVENLGFVITNPTDPNLYYRYDVEPDELAGADVLFSRASDEAGELLVLEASFTISDTTVSLPEGLGYRKVDKD